MKRRQVDKAQLMIFWDYDTQWGADRSRIPGGPKDWGYLEFENTELILDLHAQYDIPACFAVVGAAALPGKRPYHDSSQIRRIHALGHEVASHSFQHEWLPGLDNDDLEKTLRLSKNVLEQCIGAPVVSFVPPYNQPFDYWSKGSISLSERREAGKFRQNLYSLCRLLAKCGYQFCRVSYRTPILRIADYVFKQRRIDHPTDIEYIAGISCIRLNTPGGFCAEVYKMLDQCVKKRAIVVVYGHPHSLHRGGSQDKSKLIPFLKKTHFLQKQGLLEIVLPREVIND